MNAALASSKAEIVEARAAEWLARKMEFGNWSDADQAELDAWLQQSSAHLLTYARLDEAWKSADRLFALREPLPQPAVPSRKRPYLRIAAALMVLSVVGIAGANLRPQPPEVKSFSTPLGGRQILSLSDGSRVELNTSTAIHVRLTADQRTVWLDKGEAYFEVTHNAARPFAVYANTRRITDVGTKFLVRSAKSHLDVALLEGSVRLESQSRQPQATTVLTPGDEAVVSGNTTSVTKEPIGELLAKLGWRRGVIVFDHTTLADAAAELNRYNTTKISITDPSVAAITIDGTFPVNGIAAFAEAARDTFKLHASETNGEIVISR